MAAAAPTFLSQSVLDRFDIVGFDPRGTNASSAGAVLRQQSAGRAPRFAGIDVGLPPDRRPRRPSTSPARSALAARLREERRPPRPCRRREVARDLDVLRRAVGDKKLNYLGLLLRQLPRAGVRQHVPRPLPGHGHRRRARPGRLVGHQGDPFGADHAAHQVGRRHLEGAHRRTAGLRCSPVPTTARSANPVGRLRPGGHPPEGRPGADLHRLGEVLPLQLHRLHLRRARAGCTTPTAWTGWP